MRCTGRIFVCLIAALAFPAAAMASVKVPTETEGSLQVRPYVIGWTGDGTAFLGGFTGHRSVSKPSLAGHSLSFGLGRLRWTTYNATEGRAYGADWVDNGVPDNASGTFFPAKVSVHVYRPENGVFTRLTFNIGRHVITEDAINNGGFWQW
jgi:hypothetical protein